MEHLGLEPTQRTRHNRTAPEGGHRHVEHLGLEPTQRTRHNRHPKEATRPGRTHPTGHRHVEHLGLEPTQRTRHNQHPNPKEATAMDNTWG